MAWRLSLAYALALAALMLPSSLRLLGDGVEYVYMASELAGLRMPDPRTHFWLYSALAAPFVAVADGLGLDPGHGFAPLNLLLLGVAVHVTAQRLHWSLTLFLFAGPIIWWVDKPHTEVFTVSMLAIALVLLDRKPWWSLVCLGAAGAQNQPIAALAPLALGLILWRVPARRADRRVWGAALAATAMTVANPIYYAVRVGGALPLVTDGTSGALPNIDEIGVVLWDLNIGLIWAFPLIAPVVVAIVVWVLRHDPRRLAQADMLLAAGAAVVFLLSFAQTRNYNHGATPSVSRYALWLIPLTIPLLRAIGGRGTPPRWLVATALVSCVVSVVGYRPAAQDRPLEPTALARYVWTRHPGWSNPLPEVFVERLAGADGYDWVPIATAGCEKVLLTGRSDFSMWPAPCPPAPVPAECTPAGALCYANRTAADYVFSRVRRPTTPVSKLNRDLVWPRPVEATMGALLRDIRWWELGIVTGPAPGTMLRASHQVRRAFSFEGPDRFLLYAERPVVGAVVSLRLPHLMTGEIIDAVTGEPFEAIEVAPAGSTPTSVPLPPGRAAVVVRLRTGPGERPE